MYNSDVSISLSGNFTLYLSTDIFIPEEVLEAQQHNSKLQTEKQTSLVPTPVSWSPRFSPEAPTAPSHVDRMKD